MIRLTLTELADVVGGELAEDADAERVVDRVVIDSRTAAPGALFVALPGERADGHDFVADAARRGAAGALVAEDRPLADAPGLVVVDDTGDALLGLGAWLRDEVDPTVVAVTGSQGKTTTKDLLAAALGAGRRTVAAPGSYNNDLGVPLTCCLLERDSEVLVTELGTRGLGHIRRLAPLVRPDVAVVTAVGASHLELLGDVDTVARAKAELVESLEPGGVAVLNADDARVAAMAAAAPGEVVTYGVHRPADWRARDVRLDHLARPLFRAEGPQGAAVEVQLGLLGEHNVSNALAALAVAAIVGVPPGDAARALAGARPSRWRMELVRRPDGLVVLNDAYNANPASVRAALATLAAVETAGRRWAVLGTMAELGPGSQAAHAEVGRWCAGTGVDGLVTVGAAAAAISEAARAGGLDPALLHHAADADVALEALRARVRPGDVVLVKASRAVGLERLAALLAGSEREA